MDSLVSTQWLADRIAAGDPARDLCIVDASWHLPNAGRDALAEHEAGHIPGAVFLDLGGLVDASAPVDNTLPPPGQFADRMRELGIGNGCRVVLYDDSDVKSAARAWFMLRLFGVAEVAILDGGLARWKAEGRPLATGLESRPARPFAATSSPHRLRGKADVLANIASRAEQLVDARGLPRFTGEEPEPRPGIASGHIPGACNLPYKQMFAADGTWQDEAGLRAAFAAAGIDLDRPVIATCGSGVTACVLAFGLHLLGKGDVALYDGSWSEWGMDPDLPKVTGAQ